MRWRGSTASETDWGAHRYADRLAEACHSVLCESAHLLAQLIWDLRPNWQLGYMSFNVCVAYIFSLQIYVSTSII
jgi:hypothetical protein